MTFEQEYSALKDKFRCMVDKDKTCYGIESVFLPNIRPSGPVDYVIVGMEPGLNGMKIETARARIKDGTYKNWGAYPQKNPLVFAVWKYLCDEDKTKYYFTDLAHGAMNATSKDAKDRAKYERWYSLFEEELALVAKPTAKVISIGNTACTFLAEKGLYGHSGVVAHPSGQGLRYAGKEIPASRERWERFKVKSEPEGNNWFPCEVRNTLPRQKLVFDYMIRFERIRKQEECGWVALSRGRGSF